MRVAEHVLNEQLLLLSQGQVIENSASGVENDGGTNYPWALQSETWPQDAMTQLTVRVTFTVRDTQYEIEGEHLVRSHGRHARHSRQAAGRRGHILMQPIPGNRRAERRLHALELLIATGVAAIVLLSLTGPISARCGCTTHE